MFKKSTVLIVDDNTELLNILTDAFMDAGFYKAMGAVTAKEIKDILQTSKPDIILLDADIKGEPYLEILLKIKIMDRRIPVVVLADDVNRESAQKALDLGAASYIIKSIPTPEIAANVKRELGKHMSARPKKNFNILVVDDEEEIADMSRNFLNSDGYNCIAIKDPRKVKAAIVNHKPHLVFLDIVMPGMDGLEVLELIKGIDNDIKVVIMSAVTDKDICVSAVSKGASGYLAKPFSMQQLKVTALTMLLEE